jgi:5-methylcytosine-specific restriction endonuclease McrA
VISPQFMQVMLLIGKKINKWTVLDRASDGPGHKGYTVDNVVSCCSQCNTIKWDMSYSDFINKIKTIYIHLKLKD